MKDFRIIARILSAIRAGEGEPVFDCALVDEKIIQATEKERDLLAIKLQEAGLVKGLYIIDGIDNQSSPVILWRNSHPSITLAGLEYIQETDPVQKALKGIVDVAIPAIANAAIDFLATPK